MQPAPTQIPPNFRRFGELRERHAELLASVVVDIPGLGTSARITFTPVDVEEFEIVYEGVSERGKALRDTFKANPGRPATDRLPAVPVADSPPWRLSHVPEFEDPDEDEPLVGRSESLRIAAAIPEAASEYLESHRNSLMAAGLLRKVRRLAVHEAAIATEELRLASARKARDGLSGQVDDLEGRLDGALAADAAPTP